MKKFSKFMSGAMALAMVACMGTTAFAAEGNETYDDLSQNKESGHVVTVQAEVEELGTVYSVDVVWTDLAFTYSETTPASWDAKQHETVESVGTWSNQGKGSVSVTNNSNADVYAKIAYEADAGYQTAVADKGITVETVAVDSATLLHKGVAENVTAQTEGENQNKIEATVTVSGAPTASISEAVNAGTFTAVVGTTANLDVEP